MLLATFSDALAAALRTRLRRLIGNEPKIAERLEVHSMSGIGRRLYAANVGRLNLAADEDTRELLRQAAASVEGHRFGAHFLWTEWSTVVDAWQLTSWEDYRDVQRLGRKTRLAEAQRELLWSIFSRVRTALGEQGRVTEPGMFAQLAAKMAEAAHPPFDFCVIDEAQDIGVAELRLLAALGGGRAEQPVLRRGSRTADLPDAVLLAGARRRRAGAFSYAADQLPHLASDPATVRPASAGRAGRRRRQRGAANSDRLGVQRTRTRGAHVRFAERTKRKRSRVGCELEKDEGYAPHAIGVFVRSSKQIERALTAVRAAGMRAVQLDGGFGGVSGSVAVGTMHLAKGLEFRAVAVAACDDEVIPLQARIERVGDDADLEEVYGTERHLALRRLHPRAGPATGDRSRPGLGVPRRPSSRGVTLSWVSEIHELGCQLGCQIGFLPRRKCDFPL